MGKSEEQGADAVDEIDGGNISSIEPIEYRHKRHREETARTLAVTLVAILGGTAALHYFTMVALILDNKADQAEQLSRFFNAWLPVISGLVGSATTYYFTRDRG